MAIPSAVRLLAIAVAPLIALYFWQDASMYKSIINWQLFSNRRTSIPIVVSSVAAYSHFEKVIPFAEGLKQLGYPVIFLTGEEFRDNVEKTSIAFEPFDGAPGILTPEEWQVAGTLDGLELGIHMPTAAFINRMPGQTTALQRVYGQLQDKYGKDTPIVYIHDQAIFAQLPIQLGAEGIKPTLNLAIGLAPVPFESNDSYPFPAMTPPDTSADAKSIHFKAHQESIAHDPWAKTLSKNLAEKLKEMGITQEPPRFFNAMGSKDDYMMQLGIPEFEYTYSDLPLEFRYVGIPKKVGGSRELPPWWPEMLAAKRAGKHIVVVSQGSAWPDLKNLLIPTVRALADRDDLFVIATTVVWKPEDVEGLEELPINTRVAQFVPFDILLPETSLLVASGGYGTVLQSIGAGVPMVLAGTTQDKGHIGVLADHKEIAVNLKTDTPTIEAIQAAVAEILPVGGRVGNGKYRDNIEKMRKAASRYDPIRVVDETILECIKR